MSIHPHNSTVWISLQKFQANFDSRCMIFAMGRPWWNSKKNIHPEWDVLGGSSQLVVSNLYLQAIKRPFGRGPTTLLRGLTITMVINHLQVLGDPPSSPYDLSIGCLRLGRLSLKYLNWLFFLHGFTKKTWPVYFLISDDHVCLQNLCWHHWILHSESATRSLDSIESFGGFQTNACNSVRYPRSNVGFHAGFPYLRENVTWTLIKIQLESSIFQVGTLYFR